MDITISFSIKDGTVVTEDQRSALLLLLDQAAEETEKSEPDADQPDVAYTTEKQPEIPEAPDEPDEPATESEYTLEQAVELATHLLSEGKTSVVRKVLRELGVKKVGDLSGDDLVQFMKQLS